MTLVCFCLAWPCLACLGLAYKRLLVTGSLPIGWFCNTLYYNAQTPPAVALWGTYALWVALQVASLACHSLCPVTSLIMPQFRPCGWRKVRAVTYRTET